jgi:hypothetical protein
MLLSVILITQILFPLDVKSYEREFTVTAVFPGYLRTTSGERIEILIGSSSGTPFIRLYQRDIGQVFSPDEALKIAAAAEEMYKAAAGKTICSEIIMRFKTKGGFALEYSKTNDDSRIVLVLSPKEKGYLLKQPGDLKLLSEILINAVNILKHGLN